MLLMAVGDDDAMPRQRTEAEAGRPPPKQAERPAVMAWMPRLTAACASRMPARTFVGAAAGRQGLNTTSFYSCHVM